MDPQSVVLTEAEGEAPMTLVADSLGQFDLQPGRGYAVDGTESPITGSHHDTWSPSSRVSSQSPFGSYSGSTFRGALSSRLQPSQVLH